MQAFATLQNRHRSLSSNKCPPPPPRRNSRLSASCQQLSKQLSGDCQLMLKQAASKHKELSISCQQLSGEVSDSCQEPSKEASKDSTEVSVSCQQLSALCQNLSMCQEPSDLSGKLSVSSPQLSTKQTRPKSETEFTRPSTETLRNTKRNSRPMSEYNSIRTASIKPPKISQKAEVLTDNFVTGNKRPSTDEDDNAAAVPDSLKDLFTAPEPPKKPKLKAVDSVTVTSIVPPIPEPLSKDSVVEGYVSEGANIKIDKKTAKKLEKEKKKEEKLAQKEKEKKRIEEKLAQKEKEKEVKKQKILERQKSKRAKKEEKENKVISKQTKTAGTETSYLQESQPPVFVRKTSTLSLKKQKSESKVAHGIPAPPPPPPLPSVSKAPQKSKLETSSQAENKQKPRPTVKGQGQNPMSPGRKSRADQFNPVSSSILKRSQELSTKIAPHKPQGSRSRSNSSRSDTLVTEPRMTRQSSKKLAPPPPPPPPPLPGAGKALSQRRASEVRSRSESGSSVTRTRLPKGAIPSKKIPRDRTRSRSGARSRSRVRSGSTVEDDPQREMATPPLPPFPHHPSTSSLPPPPDPLPPPPYFEIGGSTPPPPPYPRPEKPPVPEKKPSQSDLMKVKSKPLAMKKLAPKKPPRKSLNRSIGEINVDGVTNESSTA